MKIELLDETGLHLFVHPEYGSSLVEHPHEVGEYRVAIPQPFKMTALPPKENIMLPKIRFAIFKNTGKRSTYDEHYGAISFVLHRYDEI